MTTKKQYVLRTDKLSEPYYFVGVNLGDFGSNDIVLSRMIFGAWVFTSRAECRRAIKAVLSDDWTISEVMMSMSPDLEMAMGGTIQ